jgi:hypothetical protein
MKTIALPSAIGLLLCLHVTPAQAQNFVSWVASNGAGVACTRAAPCATFALAHNVTDAGGTIRCVDSASFGPVTITKSVTINCTGTNAGILGFGGNGVTINGAGIDVTLRGLSIESGGDSGVQFTNGSALHIEDCRISRLDTGILIRPSGSTSVRAVLNRVTLEKNSGAGINANGGFSTGSIVVQVRDSVVARSGSGIVAVTSGGQAFTAVVVDRTSSLLNGSGILAQGASAVVHIGNSTVIGNAFGLNVQSGGQILSYQNNQASGNGVDGAPTGVLTVK